MFKFTKNGNIAFEYHSHRNRNLIIFSQGCSNEKKNSIVTKSGLDEFNLN